MAITNHERVGKALDLLREGLTPFVEREMKAQHQQLWFEELKSAVSPAQASLFGSEDDPKWDIAAVLAVMWNRWRETFGRTLGRAERSMVQELRDIRNLWAHQQTFSSDDADRALDSAERLLMAVSAPQAEEVRKMKLDLRRLVFDEQVRGERRKSTGLALESTVTGVLKPWREVVTPHPDVASGRYQQAEFAADLWQVHLNEGAPEYRNPVEFFRRTYITESLGGMLAGAIRRLSGRGGDPVVQLQTNFGGGKTHSMLALYHMISGAPAKHLAGMEEVMREAGADKLPKAKPVVLVGNKISPGNPVTKDDGTVVRTLWGELAWQLGGKKAYARIAADDEKATSPGDVLRELFKEYGPCLILIDEWVAYARQLHEDSDLPAGSFETQFSFAQVLTESAKLAENCLLVISLPASDTAASPHAAADDAEVGGEKGREALIRLRNVVGRLESSWRPAGPEEGFEIVRRRLFQPLDDPARFKERDVVARAFADFYRTQPAEFPPESREADYEKRIKAAYPIHPEVFDRLYSDWSTLIKFQRTRGVLRLMAAVIHCLWDNNDRNPLIMPGNIPIGDTRVQSELTRYLPDYWVPIIEKDVAGPNSLPRRTDNEVPNLGKHHACKRVARTIYLGSAPTSAAAHRGLEYRRVNLGCVMPGEAPHIFGDALRRLAGAATYLYHDGSNYWYSTQPTVTKLAEDRAEQLARNPDKAAQELAQRIRLDLRRTGDFSRVHPLPQSGQDVPDDPDARLVVLGIDHPYSKEKGNAAETAAQAILESRGNAPRLFRNALVFMAADKARLQDLYEAACKYLAWESILAEKDELNLTTFQVKQAENQKAAADSAVTARMPETYQWLLAPGQAKASDPVTWEAIRVNGIDSLAVRASKKLKSNELLITSFAATRLRMELDRVPLWRGDHVAIRQLVEDFGRYLYLPRLRDASVLMEAIRGGVELLTWAQDSFAYAESYDEDAERYRGLRAGKNLPIDESDPGLLVKPDVAKRQIDAEAEPAPGPTGPEGEPTTTPPSTPTDGQAAPKPDEPPKPRRFHGTVELDPERVVRDAGRIADEVITHLMGLPGASVKVTLEIQAITPDGAPDNVVRTVTENSRTLKFTSQGFEKE